MWGARESLPNAGQAQRKRWVGLVLLPMLLAALCLLSGSASAQSEAPQEAIDLYRSGRAHYDAGRYRDAIIDLKAALALDPESPNLLYNVARVSELLGNLDEAIAYYTRYVGMLSDAENDERERILATIHRLEGARTELSASASQQPETLREVIYREPPAAGTADALFWIVGGSGVALIGGSIVTGVMALSRENEVNKFVLGQDGNVATRNSLVDQANLLALASDIMLIGGVGAIATAVVLYFARTPEAPPERRVQLSVSGSRDGATLMLGGAF